MREAAARRKDSYDENKEVEQIGPQLLLSKLESSHDLIKRWDVLLGKQLDFEALFREKSDMFPKALDQVRWQRNSLAELEHSEKDHWQFVAASTGFEVIFLKAVEYLSAPSLKTRYFKPHTILSSCRLDRRSVLSNPGIEDQDEYNRIKRDVLYTHVDYHQHGLNRPEFSEFLKAGTPWFIADKWLTVASRRGKSLEPDETRAWAYLLNNFGRGVDIHQKEKDEEYNTSVETFITRMFDFLGTEVLQESLGPINYSRSNGYEELFKRAAAVYKVGESLGLTRVESLRVANQPRNFPLFMARFKLGHISSRTELLRPQDFQWPVTEKTKILFSAAHTHFPKSFQDSKWLNRFFSLNDVYGNPANISSAAFFLKKVAEIDTSATPGDIQKFQLAFYTYGEWFLESGSVDELWNLFDTLQSLGYTSLNDVGSVLNTLHDTSVASKPHKSPSESLNAFTEWRTKYRAKLKERGFSVALECGLYRLTHSEAFLTERYFSRAPDSVVDRAIKARLMLVGMIAHTASVVGEQHERYLNNEPNIKAYFLELKVLLRALSAEIPDLRLKLEVGHPVRESLSSEERRLAEKYRSISFVGYGPQHFTHIQFLEFLDFFDIAPDMISSFCQNRGGELTLKVSDLDAVVRTLAINSPDNFPKLQFLHRYNLDFPFSRIPLSVLSAMYAMDSGVTEDAARADKPNALMLMGKDDWNGSLAKRHTALKRLQRTHNVIVYQLGNPEIEMANIISNEASQNRKHSCIILSGHGSADGIVTGVDIEVENDEDENAGKYGFDRNNIDTLQLLSSILEQKCALVIDSCEPDSKGIKQFAPNMYGYKHTSTFKREVEKALPGVRVFASKKKAGLEEVIVDPHTSEVVGAEFITK